MYSSEETGRLLYKLNLNYNTFRNKEAIVVSTESGDLRDPDCVRVCGGTTGRMTTNWTNSDSQVVSITVDISDCGFVTVPTLTTSIEGAGNHHVNTGNSAVYHLSTSSFRMYLKNTEYSIRFARRGRWNVEWIAIGYTC